MALGAACLAATAGAALFVAAQLPESTIAEGSAPRPAPLRPALPSSSPDAGPLRRAAQPPPESAWQDLARQWGVEVGGEADCPALRQRNIQCYLGRHVTLATVRALDRPGIVRLGTGASGATEALLVALDERTATLREPGGREVSMPIGELEARRDRSFTTLWRSPEGYFFRVSDGPAIEWLARQLGVDSASGRRMNEDLAARIRAFQSSQGVAVDGKPGPVTFMLAGDRAREDEPRLKPGGR